MKTSVNMVRTMGSFEVIQRTKDGMFNATTLLKQWNQLSGQGKKLDNFFENISTKEFIEAIQEEEVLHTRNSVYVKSRASRGANAGTWMHPLLFIDFAMWINPRFKYQVIKFVHDQLIQYRHEAGNRYKVLTNAAAQLPGVNYRRIANGLNWIVFGRHESGTLRQSATKEQLNTLAEVQSKLAFAIDMGYIKTFEELITEMKKMYHIHHSQPHNRN